MQSHIENAQVTLAKVQLRARSAQWEGVRVCFEATDGCLVTPPCLGASPREIHSESTDRSVIVQAAAPLFAALCGGGGSGSPGLLRSTTVIR